MNSRYQNIEIALKWTFAIEASWRAATSVLIEVLSEGNRIKWSSQLKPVEERQTSMWYIELELKLISEVKWIEERRIYIEIELKKRQLKPVVKYIERV